MSTIPAHHPLSAITSADLQQFAHLVPPSGQCVLRMLGVPAGLALLNGLRGAQIVVPKGPCNNPGGARTWKQMACVIGEAAMSDLARQMGGECLEVPMLDALRTERRNQAIRSEFDQLTAKAPQGEGLSKARAVQELSQTHVLTWRQLEVILDRPSLAPVCQNNLF